MKTVNVKIDIYRFNELEEKAQNKVLENVTEFLISHVKSDETKKAIDKAKDYQTPWFMQSILLQDSKEFVMGFINDEWYYKDGRLFDFEVE